MSAFLTVGAVELPQITFNALLNLRHASLHLGAREVAVAVVHRLELGAIDRNAGLGKQIELTAHDNEPAADLADRCAIVLGQSRRSSCDPAPAGRSATSPPHCARLRVQAGGSTEPG